MKEDPNILELIDKYHQGLLSEEETVRVEKRMQTDASFAESVRVSGLVNEVVHGASLDLLRERMTADLALLDHKNKKRKNWKTGTAIGVGILIGITSMLYFTKDPSVSDHKNPLPEKRKELQLPDSSGIRKKQDTTNVIRKETKKRAPVSFSKVKEDTITKQEVMPEMVATKLESLIPKVHRNIVEESSKPVQPIIPVKTDCNLSFHAISFAACKGEEDGRIEIEEGSITGGRVPYTFSISTGQKSPDGIFTDLKKGGYTITMEDLNGCRATREVTLIEKTCSSPKSYSFNPDFGEIWKIPYEEGESGRFTIYNRQGLIIFTGTFGIDLSEWNGAQTNGSVADAGLYVCILEYSNGKKEKIDVSIIR